MPPLQREELKKAFFKSFAYDNHSEDYTEMADFWLDRIDQLLTSQVEEMQRIKKDLRKTMELPTANKRAVAFNKGIETAIRIIKGELQ